MKETEPTIIFLHGNKGGTAHNYWYPSAQESLLRAGFTVVAKDFPDAEVARRDVWLPFLEHECGANERSVLIGHSSGAIAAMRFAERHRILGSILVGAYYTDTGDENERLSGYFDDPWDWDAIRNHQQWIIQFASDNDPFFSVDEPRFVHRQLHSEYYEFPNRGHYFDTEFPELVEAALRRLRG